MSLGPFMGMPTFELDEVDGNTRFTATETHANLLKAPRRSRRRAMRPFTGRVDMA